MALLDSVRNAVPRLILASPAHRLMSGRYLLLDFRGRKTGRRFVLPVAYVVRGATTWISTDSRWWVNLAGEARFSVVLRGRRVPVTARLASTPAEATEALAALLQIPGYATAAGVRKVGGVVEDHELARAAEARRVLALDLGATS